MEDTKLTSEKGGEEIIACEELTWRKLRESVERDLISTFARFKKREREREDSRP